MEEVVVSSAEHVPGERENQFYMLPLVIFKLQVVCVRLVCSDGVFPLMTHFNSYASIYGIIYFFFLSFFLSQQRIEEAMMMIMNIHERINAIPPLCAWFGTDSMPAMPVVIH